MPRLVKGGKYVYGWSEVGSGGKVAVPDEALAEYNFNVGIYYFEREEYNAAIIRFQEVITKYPGFGFDEDSKRYIEESKKLLSEMR